MLNVVAASSDVVSVAFIVLLRESADSVSPVERMGLMRDCRIVYPSGSRLVRDIDESAFSHVCKCLKAKSLRLLNRETLLREDSPCNKIGVVIRGIVRLYRHGKDGRRSVLEDVLPGEVFGTTYAFRDSKELGVNASAVGDADVLLFDASSIMKPECREICKAHMQFVRNLLSIMCHKTLQVKQKLRILSQRTIRARLMMYLRLVAKRLKTVEFNISFDRQSLADYLCVDRSALSAELSKLKSERLIEFEKNHFRLCC